MLTVSKKYNAPIHMLMAYWGRHGAGVHYTALLAREFIKSPALNLFLSCSQQADHYANLVSITPNRIDINTFETMVGFIAGSITRLPGMCIRLALYLRKHKIRIIFIPMFHMWCPALLILGRMMGCRVYFTVHDAERRDGMSRVEIFLNEFMIRHSHFCIVLSGSVARLVHQLGVKENCIIQSTLGSLTTPDYNVTRTSVQAPRRLNKKLPLRLLFYGRLLPYKGIDILLEAYTRFIKSYKNVQLSIYGAGYLQSYTALLARCPNLIIKNRWIDDSEIPSMLQNSDILLLPYRQASQSGIVALAAYFGVPVICTDVGSLAEQVKHEQTGLVIPYENDATCIINLTQALISIIEEPQKLQILSQGALDYARTELNWQHIVDDLLLAMAC